MLPGKPCSIRLKNMDFPEVLADISTYTDHYEIGTVDEADLQQDISTYVLTVVV